jgi:2-methylcitrate dehydratase PrpD
MRAALRERMRAASKRAEKRRRPTIVVHPNEKQESQRTQQLSVTPPQSSAPLFPEHVGRETVVLQSCDSRREPEGSRPGALPSLCVQSTRIQVTQGDSRVPPALPPLTRGCPTVLYRESMHMKTDVPISPLMQQVSSHIAGALKVKLPPEVVERARLHLVDTFASMLSGSRQLPGQRAIGFVKPLGGTRQAGVVGTRIVTTMLNAALANGMFGHADETDDTHPPTRSHPGTSVIPAALALSEWQQLSGERLLRAMVLGYDLCARTLLALDATRYARTGRHAGALGQLFGATAASCALLRLDARRVRYALSYAAEHVGGIATMFRDTEHIEKSYAMGGMPAHDGLSAALMAAHGFTGVEDVFSGEPNFFSIFMHESRPDEMVRDLGRRFEIMRGGIKRWTVGGPIQGPMHVLHELIREHGFEADDVEKLVARVPEAELRVVDNRDMPDISLQHLLAVMAVDGTMTFAAAHDYRRLKDPKVRAMRERIQAVADPRIPAPVRGWRCIMEVTLKDGRRLTGETMAAKGSPDNPLERDGVAEKALDLVGPVVGYRRGKALIAALYDITRVKDVRTLRRLYSA